MVLSTSNKSNIQQNNRQPPVCLVVSHMIVELTLPKLIPKGHGEEREEVGLNLPFTPPTPFFIPSHLHLQLRHPHPRLIVLNETKTAFVCLDQILTAADFFFFSSVFSNSFLPFSVLIYSLQPAQADRRRSSQLPLGKGWSPLTGGRFITGPHRDTQLSSLSHGRSRNIKHERFQTLRGSWSTSRNTRQTEGGGDAPDRKEKFKAGTFSL